MRRRDPLKGAEPAPAPEGLHESPQEEFHRLLIELQATWGQGLNGLEKELSVHRDLLAEWTGAIPELRQAVNRSRAA
jgi:hypothetical protein